MAEKFRFFDSTLDDKRKYTSKEFADYFSTLLTSGIFADQLNALIVTAHGAEMKTILGTGKAFLRGYYYENDAALVLLHAPAHATLNRIDRVVIRLDTINRSIRAMVIQGTLAANPSPPTVTRDANTFDITLAQVRITAGKSFIGTAEVTDERTEYVSYQAKPAWYPQKSIPMDAWHYLAFRPELTAQEIADIEANPSLMAKIKRSTLAQAGDLEELQYDVFQMQLENYYASKSYYKTGLFFDGFINTSMVDAANTTAEVDTYAKKVTSKIQSTGSLVSVFANTPVNLNTFPIKSMGISSGSGTKVTAPVPGAIITSSIFRLHKYRATGNVKGFIRCVDNGDTFYSTNVIVASTLNDYEVNSDTATVCTFNFSNVRLVGGRVYVIGVMREGGNGGDYDMVMFQCAGVGSGDPQFYNYMGGFASNDRKVNFDIKGYNCVLANHSELVTPEQVYLNTQGDAVVYVRGNFMGGVVVTPQLQLYDGLPGAWEDCTLEVSTPVGGNTERRYRLYSATKGKKVKLKLNLDRTNQTDTLEIINYGVILGVL